MFPFDDVIMVMCETQLHDNTLIRMVPAHWLQKYIRFHRLTFSAENVNIPKYISELNAY